MHKTHRSEPLLSSSVLALSTRRGKGDPITDEMQAAAQLGQHPHTPAMTLSSGGSTLVIRRTESFHKTLAECTRTGGATRRLSIRESPYQTAHPLCLWHGVLFPCFQMSHLLLLAACHQWPSRQGEVIVHHHVRQGQLFPTVTTLSLSHLGGRALEGLPLFSFPPSHPPTAHHHSSTGCFHNPSLRWCTLITPMSLLISLMSLVDILVRPTAMAVSFPSA